MSSLQSAQHRRSERKAGLTSTGDRRRKIETEALSIEMAQVHRAKAKEDFRSVLTAYQEYEKHRDPSMEVELSGSQFFLLNLLLQSYEIWDAARLKEHEDLTVYLIEAYALVLHEISRGQTFLQKKLAKDHLVSANKAKSTWANVLRDVATNGTEELRAELLSLKKLENDPEAFEKLPKEIQSSCVEFQSSIFQFFEDFPYEFSNLRSAVMVDSGNLTRDSILFLISSAIAVAAFVTSGGLSLSLQGLFTLITGLSAGVSGLEVWSEQEQFSATGDLSNYDFFSTIAPEARAAINVLTIIDMMQLPVALAESYLVWKRTGSIINSMGNSELKGLRRFQRKQLSRELSFLKGANYAPAVGTTKAIKRGASWASTGKMIYSDVYTQIKARLEGDPEAKMDRVVGAIVVLSLMKIAPTLRNYNKGQFERSQPYMKQFTDLDWERPVSISSISKSFYSTYKSISDFPKKKKVPIDDGQKW